MIVSMWMAFAIIGAIIGFILASFETSSMPMGNGLIMGLIIGFVIGLIMDVVTKMRPCPYFNSSKSECRATPSASDAKRKSSWINHYCKSRGTCKDCGIYEAVKQGDYKIMR
jgi:F0F1-type ATP synthase assembly protein I